MGLLDKYGIENFYEAAQKRDFARKFQFRVISLGGNRFDDDELLYITTTTLPAREINNVPTPFMGLEFNVPGSVKYPNSSGWAVNFRLPQNLSIRRKLEDWVKKTFDDETSTGDYNTPNKNVENQAIITLIDKKGNPLRTYTLYGVYCKTFGELTLDITTAGDILEQTATLAYQYWRLSR